MLNPGHPFRVLAKTISVGSNSVLGNCAEQEEGDGQKKSDWIYVSNFIEIYQGLPATEHTNLGPPPE